MNVQLDKPMSVGRYVILCCWLFTTKIDNYNNDLIEQLFGMIVFFQNFSAALL